MTHGSGGRRRTAERLAVLAVLAAALACVLSACAEEAPQSAFAWHPCPDNALEFVGPVELNQQRVRPGDAFLCSLRFMNTSESRVDCDYRVFLHIETTEEDCQGIVFQDDHEPSPPTSWWEPGQVIDLGARVVEVPGDQEEGTFVLHAGLFYLKDEWRVLDSEATTITIDARAPLLADWVPAELAPEEVEARRAMLAERLPHQESVQTERWRFSVGSGRAAFQLEDRQSGALWTSNPLLERLGLAHLRRGEELVSAPIDSVERTSPDGDGLRIESRVRVPGHDAEVTLELLVTPVAEGAGLALSWHASAETDWVVDSVTLLDQALWTSESDGGYVVTPQWLGEIALAGGALPETRSYYSRDISMQMAGVVKQGSALLVSWTDHYAALTSHVAILDHPSVAGRTVRSLSLQLERDDPVLELYPLGRGDYVDIALAYRDVAERKGYRKTWGEKREEDPRVALQEGAPFFRLECLLPAAEEVAGEDGSEAGAQLLHTFEEVAACARHWREVLELDRALVLLGGWNHLGYDAGHPDVLPANPESGGTEGLAACAKEVRELGYLFGLHDNYQDIYSHSESWDPELLGHGEYGEMRAGGVWAGGQSWMMCTSVGLDFARRNLPRIARLVQPDFYFLDTTLTTPLQSCTHRDHPMSALEDQEYRRQLFDLALDEFGLLGLEGACEWAVPYAQFFEQILTHRTAHADKFTPVPIFSIVYGDCLNLLTRQADRLDPWDAKIFLDQVLYGEMPMYTVGDHRYWTEEDREPELSEAQARDPRYVFARGDRGWAQGLCTTDRLIKNTWEVVTWLHRAIADSPMTDHAFLRADRTAETSSFGEVRVTVNYSDEPLEVGSALLGQFGFLIEAPQYMAFHALRFGGIDYPTGACFTMRSLDDAPLVDSERVRVFHAFGDPTVRLPSQVATVERAEVIER